MTHPDLIQLSLIADQPDSFVCVPGKDWGQGFATFGGYVAASCYKAAKQAGHTRPLLSAQVNYFAPSPTSGYRIHVTALRVGKGTSIVEVTTWGANRKDPDGPEILACKILFVYGEPRGSAISVRSSIDEDTMHRLRAKRDITPDFPVLEGVIPSFLSRFHFRNTQGATPYGNSNDLAHVFAFANKGDWHVADPVEFLVLVSDINPPPQLQLLSLPANASTMTWMLDFAQPLPQDVGDDQWYHVVLQLEHANAGYGAHSGILVDDQGRVLTSTRQVTAVFEQDNGEVGLKNLPNRIGFQAGFSLFRAFNGLRQLLAKLGSRS